MKLNITQEKLQRLMLSANPVLANCKGSIKAARLMLNMLGMKCFITTKSIGIQFKLSGLAEDADFNLYNLLIAFTNALHGTYVSQMKAHGGSYGAEIMTLLNDDGTQINAFDMSIVPSSKTSYYVNVTPWSISRINYWNTYEAAHAGTNISTSSSQAEQLKYLLKAYTEIQNNFDLYKTTSAVFNNAKLDISNIFQADYSAAASNNHMYFIIPNVVDDNLQPVKYIIAKQLQEILPINKIVTEENILGIQ